MIDLHKIGLKDKDKLYRYLLKNNLAYYYARKIDKDESQIKSRVLSAGLRFNQKYNKTIELVRKKCEKKGIKFLLFKTHKYVEEVVDGDIDLIIGKNDFSKFVDLMRADGFECELEGERKASCVKKGYLKVEPRAEIAFYGKVLVGEDLIWKNWDRVKVGGRMIKKTSRELDSIYYCLNVLYGPNYIRLYTAEVILGSNEGKMWGLARDAGLEEELSMVMGMIRDRHAQLYPVFAGNWEYLIFWLRKSRVLKALAFFVYAKYLYMLTGKLVFEHDWKV